MHLSIRNARPRFYQTKARRRGNAQFDETPTRRKEGKATRAFATVVPTVELEENRGIWPVRVDEAALVCLPNPDIGGAAPWSPVHAPLTEAP